MGFSIIYFATGSILRYKINNNLLNSWPCIIVELYYNTILFFHTIRNSSIYILKTGYICKLCREIIPHHPGTGGTRERGNRSWIRNSRITEISGTSQKAKKNTLIKRTALPEGRGNKASDKSSDACLRVSSEQS